MKSRNLFLHSIRKTVLGICLIAVCSTIAGCAADSSAAWREYKVYCGLSSKHGEVPEEAWKRFCDEYVSAAFPAGYTVIDAAGYWRQAPETTAKERAKIILLVAPADARTKVLAVAKWYRKLFDQESVLISTMPAEADFVRKE